MQVRVGEKLFVSNPLTPRSFGPCYFSPFLGENGEFFSEGGQEGDEQKKHEMPCIDYVCRKAFELLHSAMLTAWTDLGSALSFLRDQLEREPPGGAARGIAPVPGLALVHW